MKVIFICGSLEPGRDGVGDYTRRLAGELIRKGHHAAMIALNDQHIQEELDCIQESDGNSMAVLRLPSKWQAVQRFKKAGFFVEKFNPDMISLQFVPFSFHPKGLAFGMGNLMQGIANGRPWHIMVHELWVGMNKEASTKFKYWGQLQRVLIKSLFRKLKPVVVHTQTTLYMRMLERLGFKPKYLPLFGNIPVPQIDEHSDTNIIHKNDRVTGLYFGSAPSEQYHEFFAEKIKKFCTNYGPGLQLVFCGKSGKHLEVFIEKIEAACKGFNCTISSLGPQESARLTELFLEADFGIARNPPRFISKNGSVIAMLEHGLPLWVPLLKEDSAAENLDFRPELCFEELADILRSVKRKVFLNRLPIIAERFLSDIS